MPGVGESHNLVLTTGLQAFNVEIDNAGDGDAAPSARSRINNGHVPGAEKRRDELAPTRHRSAHLAR
jgi:hypothetical protein